MPGNQASAVPQGDVQRRARPESEDVTDQPAATQIRVEEVRRPQWTMSSSVKDILLEGSTLSTNMRLNDFLRNYVGGRVAVGEDSNVTMQVFVQEPDAYVQDQRLLGRIFNLPEYQELEEKKILLEAIYKLRHGGVDFLEQWRDYEGKDTVTPLARRKLNAVLTQVLREERREEVERARREKQVELTLITTIRDVLFKGRVRFMDIKLNDFLTLEMEGRGVLHANRNVLLRDFFSDPTRYIPDAGVLGEIQATDAYARMEGDVREEMDMGEDVRKLKQAGVYNLQKWSEATAQVKESVHEITKSFLDAALQEANKPTMTSAPMKLEGCYESVYNSRWHHVVEVPGGEGMGMEVREGEPEQSLTYREFDESLERDDAVQQSGAPRPRLMVLTSEKGWPYSWAGNKLIHDCYVNFEVDRVWQIVKSDLTELLSSHPGAYFEPKRRVLIGTPGIGKSMGAGSYLLYQLLHCDAEKLPVVVYVIGRQAFLFDKTTHTMIRYMELSAMEHFLAFVSSRGVKGYIIYDVAKGGRNPSVFFVPSEWGMLVVTSPNVDNFEEWRKHKGAAPIIINCPEEMDVKAMCFWMKQIQPTGEQAEEQLEEQARYWETVEERMDEVGPIPRCIFDVLEYGIHLNAIDATVKDINASNATDYMGVGSGKIWIAKGVSHKIVKVVRVREGPGIEVGYNAPVSHSARVKITHHLTNMTPPVD
ncbi:putative retrotransposon hot spot (RHS) protein, partial [Trypanosoma cruzi]